AELSAKLLQRYATVQPQPEKKTLLHCFLALHWNSLDLLRHKEVVKRIGGRQPNAFDALPSQRVRCRHHGMRVYSEPQIRLPRPVLQIVTRLESSLRKI